ncbi:MAG: class I SAM-dependent methyltransferase [Bacteroidota bacterium]
MSNTLCPLCQKGGLPQRSNLFKVEKSSSELYFINKCSYCGMVYTSYNHNVDPAELYDQNDYTVKDTRNSIFFKIQKWEYDAVISRIRKICRLDSPTLLDFGSGKGLFLHLADQKGFRGKGIESSKPRAKYAAEYFGLEINTDYYSTGNVFGEKFDVLTSFHVFEHLTNPAELLNNLVKHNLKDGGLLIIEVPNFGSWQSAWAGSSWLHLDVPRHIGHFQDETLKQVVHGAGCTIIKKEYFSLHLGIIGMIQTLFSWFGYRGFIIAELKQRKSVLLIIKIALVLPFAVLAEALAVLFHKGGILRYYALYDNGNEE